MAVIAIKTARDLGPDVVLAPERYDPRRTATHQSAERGPRLEDLVQSIRRTISPKPDDPRLCLVLDTSDAREGLIVTRKRPVPAAEIGSTKKLAEPGDVIISRLRPYLRQVAYVDDEIPGRTEDAAIVCSTEFFVLRSADDRSIAFLVPFLLSDPVQAVLAVSQEGGHHPRVDRETLLGLCVADGLLTHRADRSAAVLESVRRFRQSERQLADLIVDATPTRHCRPRDGNRPES